MMRSYAGRIVAIGVRFVDNRDKTKDHGGWNGLDFGSSAAEPLRSKVRQKKILEINHVRYGRSSKRKRTDSPAGNRFARIRILAARYSDGDRLCIVCGDDGRVC